MLQEVVRVVIIPLVMMAAVLGIFYLLFGRRIRGHNDPPGFRSFATFTGGDDSLRIADTLVTALQRVGLDANPPQREEYGSTFEAGSHETGFVVHLGRARQKEQWLLSVEPIGRANGVLVAGPGLKRLLMELDGALRKDEELSDVSWHYRQDYNAGLEDQAATSPERSERESKGGRVR